jgi:N-acetylmuramoyl-L-alanine amidase
MSAMRRPPLGLRVALTAAMAATMLVPALWQPARALTYPVTLARAVTSTGHATATLRFPATHIAFSWSGDEGSGVRYRTFDDAGEPSAWLRAVEAHDLEHDSSHYSGVITVARPSAVEWEPLVAPGVDIGPVTLDYLNTMDGPRRRIEVPSSASAAIPDPDIVTRAEWGADESIKRTSGSCTRQFHPVQQLFVHHTVGTNDDPHPKATMRSIYWYHAVRRGWCDIGYNFVISPDGRIFEGRWSRDFDAGETHDGENRKGEIVQGSHTESFNSGSIGVSLMGNYSTDKWSSAMRRALVRFLSWEVDRHNLKLGRKHVYRNPVTGTSKRIPVIAGHRDAGYTECPGNNVYKGLPRLRRSVANEIARSRATTVTTLESLTPVMLAGQNASFVGTLTSEGLGLPGKKIHIHFKPAGKRWRRNAVTATTEPDGRFMFDLRLQRDALVVAEFYGDREAWPSKSPRVSQDII